jgi:hypothetical protein
MRVLQDEAPGLLAVGGGVYPISALGQNARRDGEHHRVVFDQQDGFGTAGSAGDLPRHWHGFGHGFDTSRQQYGERRTGADLAGDADVAAGLAHDAITGGETETAAETVFLGGEERLERVLDNLRRHAEAVIADPQRHIVAGRQGLARPFHHGVLHRDLELAAIRHRIAGVAGEMQDQRLDLIRIDEHRPHRMRRLPNHRTIRRQNALQPALQRDDPFTEIDEPRHRRLTARKRQQLPGQRLTALDGAQDLIDIVGTMVIPGRRGAQPFGVELHGEEQHVEVMRDAAGQERDRFHLARALLFARGSGLIADVAADGGNADHLAVGRAQRRQRQRRRKNAAVVAHPVGFEPGDALAAPGAAELLPRLGAPVDRHHEIEIAPDGLHGRKPEGALGRRIPIQNHAIRAGHDDEVFGRGDQRLE